MPGTPLRQLKRQGMDAVEEDAAYNAVRDAAYNAVNDDVTDNAVMNAAHDAGDADLHAVDAGDAVADRAPLVASPSGGVAKKKRHYYGAVV